MANSPKEKINGLAIITEMFPVRCEFTKDGCIYNRTGWAAQGVVNSRGCCSDCVRERGYFQRGRGFEKNKHLFNDKTGFWREGEGCILPRKERSLTCLGFFCSASVSKAEERDKRKLYQKAEIKYMKRLSSNDLHNIE